MSSARERRAAREGRVPPHIEAAIAPGYAALPKPTDAECEAFAYCSDTEEPMKIQFTAVMFDQPVPRFGDKGWANSSTKLFHAESHGVVIEYDTATQLVRLTKGDLTRFVHVAKVEYFDDTLDGAAAVAAARKEAGREAAIRSAQEQAAQAAADIAALSVPA